MFAGHNAYPFQPAIRSTPTASCPTVGELVERLQTGD